MKMHYEKTKDTWETERGSFCVTSNTYFIYGPIDMNNYVTISYDECLLMRSHDYNIIRYHLLPQIRKLVVENLNYHKEIWSEMRKW